MNFDDYKKNFGEMEVLKWRAYEAGEMNVALFWQGEQVRKQLADIYFQGVNK